MKDNYITRVIRWYKRPNKSAVADLLESLIVIIPVVFLIKTFIFGLYQVPTGSMETTMLVGERFFADKVTPYFSKPKRGEIISFNNPLHKYSSNWFVNMWQQYADWNVINYTKRVIAVPGDHIQGKVEDGKPVVCVNGQKLDEPYLNKYPVISVFKPAPISLRTGIPGEIHRRSYDPDKPFDNQSFYRLNPVEISRAKMYLGGENIFHPGTPAYNSTGKLIDEYDVTLGPDEYWMMGDNRQGSFDSRDWGPWNSKKAIFHGRIVFRIWSVDSDESWWIFDLIKHPIDFFKRVRWSRFFQMLH